MISAIRIVIIALLSAGVYADVCVKDVNATLHEGIILILFICYVLGVEG